MHTTSRSYQVLIDNEVASEGSLLENFEPPFNPPAEIDDPSDSKPNDWVDDITCAPPPRSAPPPHFLSFHPPFTAVKSTVQRCCGLELRTPSVPWSGLVSGGAQDPRPVGYQARRLGRGCTDGD